MKNTSNIGNLGENIACKYLVQKGYTILERNFLRKYGEIDIIARDPGGDLVFVEVKSLKQNNSITPEENMTSQKLRKLRKICESYARMNDNLVREEAGWRMDLVAISLPQNAINENEELTEIIKDCIINHYENIG